MVNKCLLSLLVVISITTLCKVNANVTSCYVGTYGDVEIKNCSEDANYGCFQLYDMFTGLELGCADQAYCEHINEDRSDYGFCCLDKDNCNGWK